MSKRNFLFAPDSFQATSFETVERGILLRYYNDNGSLMPKKETTLHKLAARAKWQALVDSGWLTEAKKEEAMKPKPEPAPEPEPTPEPEADPLPM